MIPGDKPSAFGVTRDAEGRRVEQEFRQCSHCQASWPYVPGSGHKVGLCSFCMGLLCTKCASRRWKQVEKRCLPFYDTALENSNKYFLDPNAGVYMRK